MKKILILFFIGFVILLSNCTKVYLDEEICFQENILPIFISNCAISGCHNSVDKEEGYDLSTYEGIMKGIKPNHPALSEVFTSMSGKHAFMPPSPFNKVSDQNLNKIKLWILNGAPNSSNCFTCDTINFTYSLRIKSLMDSWCVGCHNPNLKEGGIDLTTYAGVKITVLDGSLQGSIHHQSGFVAMPKNTGAMSSCDINAIDQWIALGYPNN